MSTNYTVQLTGAAQSAYIAQRFNKDNQSDVYSGVVEAQERLEHWARLRRDYPAIERTK
mgnify:CR=1 FL=1